MSLRFSLLAGAALLLSPLASAQVEQIDFSPTSSTYYSESSVAPVDSIFYDTGDNDAQFSIGFGFPTDANGDIIDPKAGGRATSYIHEVLYTVPDDRTEFVLTGVTARYRTANVSSQATGRIRYEADAPPLLFVFRGNTSDPLLIDSTVAPTAVYSREMPFTTAFIISAADGAMIPILENVSVNFAEDGETVPNDLRFLPGEEFIIQMKYFNVPFPAGVEAGSDVVDDIRSRSGQAGLVPPAILGPDDTLDLLTFNGKNVADTGGADSINDQWYLRAISDDAFFGVASEGGPAGASVAIGNAVPNPSASSARIPFLARSRRGHPDGRLRRARP